jgi:hypothetical protein
MSVLCEGRESSKRPSCDEPAPPLARPLEATGRVRQTSDNFPRHYCNGSLSIHSSSDFSMLRAPEEIPQVACLMWRSIHIELAQMTHFGSSMRREL